MPGEHRLTTGRVGDPCCVGRGLHTHRGDYIDDILVAVMPMAVPALVVAPGTPGWAVCMAIARAVFLESP